MRRDSANDTGADGCQRLRSVEGRRQAVHRRNSTEWAPTDSDGSVEPSHERERRRAQTTLDFAVGMSIFLLLVVFVFAFAPGFLAPFTTGPVEETVTVNRVADQLAMEGLSQQPDEPYVVDDDCAAVFFDEDSNGNWACSFAGDSLEEELNVSTRQNVNVSLVGNTSATPAGENVLCWDDATETLSEDGQTACSGVWLARGSNPAGAQETVTAKRVVALSGHNVTLEVEMW